MRLYLNSAVPCGEAALAPRAAGDSRTSVLTAGGFARQFVILSARFDPGALLLIDGSNELPIAARP
jgi:hypothetical protein